MKILSYSCLIALLGAISTYYLLPDQIWISAGLGFVFAVLFVIAMNKELGRKSDHEDTAETAPKEEKPAEPKLQSLNFTCTAQSKNSHPSTNDLQKGFRVEANVNCYFLPKDEMGRKIMPQLIKNIAHVIIAQEFGKKMTEEIFSAVTEINANIKTALIADGIFKKYCDENLLFIGIIPDLGKWFNKANIDCIQNLKENIKSVEDAASAARQIEIIEEKYKKILEDLIGGKIDTKEKAEVFSLIVNEARHDGKLPGMPREKERKPLSPLVWLCLVFGSFLALLIGGWIIYALSQPTKADIMKTEKFIMLGKQRDLVSGQKPGMSRGPKIETIPKFPNPAADKKEVVDVIIDTLITGKRSWGTSGWAIGKLHRGYVGKRIYSSDTIGVGRIGVTPVYVDPKHPEKDPYFGEITEFYVISKDEIQDTVIYRYVPAHY